MMNYYIFIQAGEPRNQKPIHDGHLILSRFSHWKYPYSAMAKETEISMETMRDWAKRDGLKGYVFRITYGRMIEVQNLPGASCKLFDIPTMRVYSDEMCGV